MPKTKARLMAEHFVTGDAEIRGDWLMSADAAGFRRTPREDDESVLRAIDEVREEADRQQEFNDRLEEIDIEGITDWTELANRLIPLKAQIALGRVTATAAQARALEEIMLRGLGRVTEQHRDPEPPGLVVLPMLGSQETLQVCPNCLQRLEEKSGSESNNGRRRA